MELTGRLIAEPAAPLQTGTITIRAGRIVAVESRSNDAEADLPVIGAGFIDSHTHPLELGLQFVFADLSGVRSLDALLAALAQRLSELGPSPVMLGLNFEPDALEERRYPLRTELDRVSATTPILVYRVDGHSAALNTPGIELALSAGAAKGVELGSDGRPSGVLRGPAYELTSRAFKRQLDRATVRLALQLAAGAAAGVGITTLAALVGGDDNSFDDWRFLLEALEPLPVQAVPFLQTRRTEVARSLGLPRVGGCILIDGSFGSHSAALSSGYSDAPDNRGAAYVTDSELLQFFGDADAAGLQTAVHAIGDRAVEQVIRCHEAIRDAAGGNPLRHRVEHAELLNEGLVERLSALEMVVGVQPAFEAHWGGGDRMYARRLGERWRWTNPYRLLLDRGVRLAGGSDAPITPLDPLAGIRAAVAHPNPEQRISGPEAYALFTTGSAFSLDLEQSFGRLTPGHWADLALLSSDPRTLGDCRVLATYRAGRLIYRASVQ